MSWSDKYKRSINCNNPNGFSQRAHCAARKKRQKGEPTKSKSPFNEMHEVKSHKTIEQIAKKHRLDASFVQKQLEMGIPIEHEHTKDKDLATDIALQHLDEIPDYYTRLKKMEASAKKEHKKFKDFKEHCGCEDDAVSELESALKKLDDTSYNSIDKLMRRIMEKHNITAKQLHNAFVDKNKKTPDDWVRDLGEATDGIRAKNYKGRLDRWFDDGGWVQTGGKYDGKPCAKQPGQTTKPYCRDPDDRAAMSKEERNKRAAKKRREDPNPNRTGKAKMVTQESAGEKDACYKKVKSRYKVWPSAYASGALVKCRKVGASNWGTKSEEVDSSTNGADDMDSPMHIHFSDDAIRYCPACQKNEKASECKYGKKYWKMFSHTINLASDKHYTPNTPHPGNMPEGYDHEYSMARSEISTIISAAKRLKKKIGKGEGNLEAWVQSKITKAADYIDTAADYVDSGEMKEETTVADRPATRAEREKIRKMLELERLQRQKRASGIHSDVNVTTRESVSIQDANGNQYAEFIDIIKPEPLRATQGIGSRMLDIEEGLKQARKNVGASKCWPGKVARGTKIKNGIEVPDCKESKKTFGEFMAEASPAWQRKEGKNPTGGLNAAGRASAKAQGHNLKPPVTTPPSKLKPGSKAANRRRSFCARMGGMPGPMKDEKGRPTRKALSLRKWNC